ncbi:hypothetical protein K432DRAFT_405238 [Lepidopterella palustris CBS 459.81]|uniref:Btz domain-containing protein n=1 Tax=Lepidopterella palustris CBS 459.81 TaxID=1314670 RepID=A0A8E2E9R0_9PEZI|nr:hypothetical protein K432DRAFT_405238 [Lepidopterella palustris CBS 459.81]
MAPPRKRPLVTRRRRRDEEGEEDGSVATELVEDSQSEISVPSDVDEDADADDSDLSDIETTPSITTGKPGAKVNGASKVAGADHNVTTTDSLSPAIARSSTNFTALTDTEVMMNGLKISEGAAEEEGVDFDAAGKNPTAAEIKDTAVEAPTTASRQETLAEKRRREYEEYKQKKDADPAFIPNRGAFFMHDQRSAAGQNGFRPYGRGRGRGRGTVGGPYSPAGHMGQSNEPTDSPWEHDLHQTLIEPPPPPPSQKAAPPIMDPSNPPTNNPSQFIKPALPVPNPVPKAAPVRSFSTTVQTGHVVVRVFLPGMKPPKLFPGVPVKQHTRLPNHRPPLRRDKPVRISLPDKPPRYIFPIVERSFIFIPRALRPNQQGFGRGRGRGFGSYGGFSSRRTSAYGGSVYSPSVAMSRRSSLAREIGRDGLVSPSGSILSRAPGGPPEAGRPVVRLPPGSQQPMMASPSSSTPVVNIPQPQTYPLPQKPAFRENWPGQIPMHQPRPQKTVSVAAMESPASMTFHAPQQQEQQPFHQQVPAHVNGSSAQADQHAFYPHSRQLSYPSQASTGTPLSNIPERAIHAPAFQPFQQPVFQPQGFPMQPGYYYPPPANGVQPQFAAPSIVPVFVQTPQQGAYVIPVAAPAAPAAPTSVPGPQPAMVAYESNGMTYYYDPTQVYQPVEGYAPPSYAIPGMGGMMTPSPDGYYYPQVPPPGGVFYQPQ